jgi:hypothetical protein
LLFEDFILQKKKKGKDNHFEHQIQYNSYKIRNNNFIKNKNNKDQTKKESKNSQSKHKLN